MHVHRVAFSVLILTTALVYGHVGVKFTAGPPEGRIVNGTEAKPGQFPFIVSLQTVWGSSHFCGGSILNENFVMTAAHCMEYISPSQVKIVAGTNVLSEGGQEHKISKIIVHEKYDAYDSWRNDIALLQLELPLTFGDKVKATSLPPQGYETPAKTPATVIGWGHPYTGGSTMNKLQFVEIQIYSDEQCGDIHDSPIYPTNICAGVPGGGKGQCSGDSGGPLVAEGYQVGIVSWSVKPCAVAPYPGVFTQVSKYVDWIKSHTSTH